MRLTFTSLTGKFLSGAVITLAFLKLKRNSMLASLPSNAHTHRIPLAVIPTIFLIAGTVVSIKQPIPIFSLYSWFITPSWMERPKRPTIQMLHLIKITLMTNKNFIPIYALFALGLMVSRVVGCCYFTSLI